MIKTRLKYVVCDPDPRGNNRYYVRRKIDGKFRKVRVREPFEYANGSITEAFMAAYHAALAEFGGKASAPKPTPREDTFAWLWDEYQRSPRWRAFDRATQTDKRSVLGRWIVPIEHLPFRRYQRKDVLASQAKRADTPAAADKLVKYLRAWFEWAVREGHMAVNPAIGVEKIAPRAEGAHSWTAADLKAYRTKHPIGTQARLGLELMLQVGARISDAARLGRQHEYDDPDDGSRWIGFTAFKNRAHNPVRIDQPMRDELVEAIRACNQVGDVVYLVTEKGVPFTTKGLGNKVREWCDAAELQHCSAHGLRKASATEHAESGASAHQLMAWFGWTRMETAEIYTRAAEKKRLARDVHRLSEHRRNKSVSVSKAEITDETKRGKKR